MSIIAFCVPFNDDNNNKNKRAGMALNRSPEFMGVTVQFVCVVEIQFESAWVLTNIISGNTCHAKFHESEASGSEEDDLNIFLCISMVQNQNILGRIHFFTLGPLFKQTRLRTA